MSLPESFCGRFSVPVIASPMFLLSDPDLVVACCKAGVAGTLPSLNTRTSEDLSQWLDTIANALGPSDGKQPYAPYGVNLILHTAHSANSRQDADLDVVVAHRVPFVITSLGNPQNVVRAVHAYGGLVFSDVIHAKHAHKAIEVGVDGLIAVGNGAGGHAGTQSLFSLARELRNFWNGTLVLGGAISDGQGVRAAEVLGADLAYLGSRFIATQECRADPMYKQMMLDATAQDVVYTDAVSGIHANMLRQSLLNAYGPDWQARAVARQPDGPKAWRDVWSAGHGVAVINDLPSVATLVARLRTQYLSAVVQDVSPAMSGTK